MIRRLLCRLPLRLRERFGFGLPPRGRLVFATIRLPQRGGHVRLWVRYYPRSAPFEHSPCSGRTFSHGLIVAAPSIRSGGLSIYSERWLVDWHDPQGS